MKAKQLSLSALMLLLPAGALASPEGAQPRIYVVDPARDHGADRDGLWRPTAEEVEWGRKALIDYLSIEHPSPDRDKSWNERNRPEIRDRIDTYILQFAGVRMGDRKLYYSTRGNGPKAILITGLCANPFRDDIGFTSGIVRIADGGACFFIAIYDPAENRIIRFEVNGVA